jgi:D-arabinitol 2-dehydrogenase
VGFKKFLCILQTSQLHPHTMFKPQFLRQLARTSSQWQAPRAAALARQPIASSLRQFSCSPYRRDKDDRDYDAATTAGEPGESGDHEGQYARTGDIRVEYPEEKDLPRSQPVQGRGGQHFKRTLAAFSLEGRVAAVTGGARGLGLVMAQALVFSGADVALVDMNRDEAQRSAQGLIDQFKEENPNTEK